VTNTVQAIASTQTVTVYGALPSFHPFKIQVFADSGFSAIDGNFLSSPSDDTVYTVGSSANVFSIDELFTNSGLAPLLSDRTRNRVVQSRQGVQGAALAQVIPLFSSTGDAITCTISPSGGGVAQQTCPLTCTNFRDKSFVRSSCDLKWYNGRPSGTCVDFTPYAVSV